MDRKPAMIAYVLGSVIEIVVRPHGEVETGVGRTVLGDVAEVCSTAAIVVGISVQPRDHGNIFEQSTARVSAAG